MLVSDCVVKTRSVDEKEITRNFDALYKQSTGREEE